MLVCLSCTVSLVEFIFKVTAVLEDNIKMKVVFLDKFLSICVILYIIDMVMNIVLPHTCDRERERDRDEEREREREREREMLVDLLLASFIMGSFQLNDEFAREVKC